MPCGSTRGIDGGVINLALDHNVVTSTGKVAVGISGTSWLHESGASGGWVWDGVPNASPSTGPARYY